MKDHAVGWSGVEGKRVLITGATNGIGLAAAEALGALGARLTIVARGAHIPFGDFGAISSYHGFRRYGETKLANILFTAELARRLEGTGVTANCFHPGLVATGFNRNNGALMRLTMILALPFSRSAAR